MTESFDGVALSDPTRSTSVDRGERTADEEMTDVEAASTTVEQPIRDLPESVMVVEAVSTVYGLPARRSTWSPMPTRMDTGLMVPTGEFDPVDVLIVDEDGEPIQGQPLWILPRERFPVASPVNDDGTARLWLLEGFVYQRFQLLVHDRRVGGQLVYYEATEQEVRGSDDAAILQFEESELSIGGLTPGISQMG